MEAARANRRSPRGHPGQRLPPGGSLSRPSLPRRCHPTALDSATRWSSFRRSCPSCLRLVTLLERNGRYTQRLIEESPPRVAVNVATWNCNAMPNEKKRQKPKKRRKNYNTGLIAGCSNLWKVIVPSLFRHWLLFICNLKAHTVMKLSCILEKNQRSE